MNNTIKIACLCLSMALSACGGSSSTGGTTTNDTTINIGTPGTFLVTITGDGKPLPNAVVQIDGNGATATTDANGKASISGQSTGLHDIHVFSPNSSGLPWGSIYQTKATNINMDLFGNAYSAINYSGTVSNMSQGSSLGLLLEDVSVGKSYHDGYCVVGNPTATSYSCRIYAPVPEGTTGNFNLWALEYDGNGTVIDGDKLQDKASYSIMTISTNSTVLSQNITFNTTKPAPTQIVTVSSATPAPGLTFDVSEAAVGGFFSKIIGSASVLGNPVVAYNPFPATYPVWATASGSDASGSNWGKAVKTTAGSSVSLNAAITVLPAIAAQNLNGAKPATINFQAGQGNFLFHSIILSDANTSARWRIVVPASAFSVVLPTIPVGVSPLLANGSVYDLDVTAIAPDGVITYDEVAAGIDAAILNFTGFEGAHVPSVTLTR